MSSPRTNALPVMTLAMVFLACVRNKRAGDCSRAVGAARGCEPVSMFSSQIAGARCRDRGGNLVGDAFEDGELRVVFGVGPAGEPVVFGKARRGVETHDRPIARPD